MGRRATFKGDRVLRGGSARRRVVRTSTADAIDVEHLPVGLVLKGGEWFLVAESGIERSVFAVADLDGFGTTGARFPYPEDFELHEWWRDWVATRSTAGS